MTLINDLPCSVQREITLRLPLSTWGRLRCTSRHWALARCYGPVMECDVHARQAEALRLAVQNLARGCFLGDTIAVHDTSGLLLDLIMGCLTAMLRLQH